MTLKNQKNIHIPNFLDGKTHYYKDRLIYNLWLPWGYSDKKNPPANAEDPRDSDSIPGLRRFPRVGNGNPLWYSCMENFMDREPWWATVHWVTKSQTRLE